MYVSAADNDYVGVTGTFLGTASQGVWSTARLDFSVPPGGIAKLHFGAFGGSIPGLVQQSAGTPDLYSTQIRASAFEGESVSVADLLADSLALTGSANAGNFTTVGDVSTGTLTGSGAATAASFAATGALTGATLTITGAASAGVAGLREPGLHLHGHERRSVDGQRGARRRDELGHGLRAAALRLQHAHRDQHLRLLGRSLPDEELGGWSKLISNNSAASDSGRSCGCWATAPGSSWSGMAERTSASSS